MKLLNKNDITNQSTGPEPSPKSGDGSGR